MTRQNTPPSDQGQMRYLAQSIRLKESASPGLVRHTVFIISLTVVAFLGWASLAHVSEIARSPGEVIPDGHAQVVQHLEGGIIRDIFIKNGQHVKQGQLLLRMADTDVREDLNRVQSRQTALELQEERLRAFIDGRVPHFNGDAKNHPALVSDTQAFFTSMKNATEKELKVIEDQIAQKKQSIGVLVADLQAAQSNFELTANLLSRRQDLNSQGILSDVKLMETQQRYNDLSGKIAGLKNQVAQARSALVEYENRKKSISASSIDNAHKELEGVVAEKTQNANLIDKLKARIERLDITAPTDGIIKGLAVNTIGSVVQPAQVLAEIIPTNETLVVNLKIPPRYIGHIKTGQAVQVKLSSYDFARYGSVAGTLEDISATTFAGENGERFYEGKVRLKSQHINNDPAKKILPGMTVMADIVTGDKTILAYLLKPIQTAMSTAFTER